MKKYMAAAVIISITLAAGCNGNASSLGESSSQTDSSTAEVTTTTSAAPTEQPEEVPVTEAAPEQTETTTAVQTEAPQETSAAENPGNYIADWIYGTWSVVSVNGQDYWDHAFANGLTEQSQLVFDSDGTLHATGGKVGVENEYTYKITDEGAEAYYSDGEKAASLVYDPSTDTMTITVPETGDTAVVKRGEYPQPEAGLDYIADWIYGTWDIISMNGGEYWDDEDQKLKMVFTSQGVDVTRGGEVLVSMTYRITDEGAELRDTDGEVFPAVYSPAEDTLTFTLNGDTGVAKRGTASISGGN